MVMIKNIKEWNRWWGSKSNDGIIKKNKEVKVVMKIIEKTKWMMKNINGNHIKNEMGMRSENDDGNHRKKKWMMREWSGSGNHRKNEMEEENHGNNEMGDEGIKWLWKL